MEDMIKLTYEKFPSISKDNWKVRHNHVISMEALLDEGQEIAVHVRNDSSESDGSLNMSKSGSDGADQHGVVWGGSIKYSDTDQQCSNYSDAVKVCFGDTIIATIQCY
jgi:hypothetical protein